MLEIFKKRKKGDKYVDNIRVPSLLQMKSAVQRFVGMMSTLQFAILVEKVMSLDQHGCVTLGTQAKGQKREYLTLRMIAASYAIADALYKLFEVFRDNSKT